MRITYTIYESSNYLPYKEKEMENNKTLYFTFKGKLCEGPMLEIEGVEDEDEDMDEDSGEKLAVLEEKHLQILLSYLIRFQEAGLHLCLINLKISTAIEEQLVSILKDKNFVALERKNCTLETEHLRNKKDGINYLYQLPHLGKLERYKVIESDGSDLDETLRSLPLYIRNNPKFHTLILKADDEESFLFPPQLLLKTCELLPALKILNLSNFNLFRISQPQESKLNASSLINLIKNSKTIEELTLHNVCLNLQEENYQLFVKKLAKILLKNNKLKKLSLPLPEYTKQYFLNNLPLYNPQIKIVDSKSKELLSQSNLKLIDYSKGSNLNDQQFERLCFFLQFKTMTTLLKLGWNVPSDKNLRLLGQSLSFSRSLQTFDFISNFLSSGSKMQYLAQGLVLNDTLKDLNLSGNQINDQGTKCLARILANNSSLISLNLSYNLIQSSGFKFLVDSLVLNSTLQILDLERNENLFRQGNYRQLARLIQLNYSLSDLNIKLTSDSGKGKLAEVFKALKGNSSLQRLNLDYTYLKSKQNQEILTSLKYNRALKFIDLGTWHFDKLAPLAEMLRVNTSLTAIRLGPVQSFSEKEWTIFAKKLRSNTTINEIDFGNKNFFSDSSYFGLQEIKFNHLAIEFSPNFKCEVKHETTRSRFSLKLFRLQKDSASQFLTKNLKRKAEYSLVNFFKPIPKLPISNLVTNIPRNN